MRHLVKPKFHKVLQYVHSHFRPLQTVIYILLSRQNFLLEPFFNTYIIDKSFIKI